VAGPGRLPQALAVPLCPSVGSTTTDDDEDQRRVGESLLCFRAGACALSQVPTVGPRPEPGKELSCHTRPATKDSPPLKARRYVGSTTRERTQPAATSALLPRVHPPASNRRLDAHNVAQGL
jgi:hypothetical protein